jgi:hypothetical protein
MHPELTLILATNHQQDLLTEAARERLATEVSGPRRSLRERVGAGLIRLGLRLPPATPTQATPTPCRPRTAC